MTRVEEAVRQFVDTFEEVKGPCPMVDLTTGPSLAERIAASEHPEIRAAYAELMTVFADEYQDGAESHSQWKVHHEMRDRAIAHSERRNDEAKQLARARRYYAEMVPPNMRQEIDPARLSGGLVDVVRRWGYGPTGLLLVGETGMGKTRMVWETVRRLADESITTLAFTAAQFDAMAHAYAMREEAYKLPAMRDEGYILVYESELTTAPVVFLDDIGKGRMTASAQSLFFAMIDARINAYLPTIITGNLSPVSIGAIMGDDRGPALMRRILDSFRSVYVHPDGRTSVCEPVAPAPDDAEPCADYDGRRHFQHNSARLSAIARTRGGV